MIIQIVLVFEISPTEHKMALEALPKLDIGRSKSPEMLPSHSLIKNDNSTGILVDKNTSLNVNMNGIYADTNGSMYNTDQLGLFSENSLAKSQNVDLRKLLSKSKYPSTQNEKSKRSKTFHLQNPISLSRKGAPYLLTQLEAYLSQNLPSEGSIMKKLISSGHFKQNIDYIKREYLKTGDIYNTSRLDQGLDAFKNDDLKLHLQLERLAVYRNSFTMFINHFKMYKPVLETIRNEYDKKIEILQSELENVKEYENIVKREGENIQIKIHQLSKEHEIKMKEIKEENKKLEEMLRLTQIEEHEIERKVQEMHFSIREIDNSRKEEKERAATLQDALQFSQDSVQKMKKKLGNARIDQESHTHVRKMYSDSLAKLGMMDKMIRKEDYLKLVEKNKEEENNIYKLNNQLNVMKRANNRMQEEIIQLKMEIEASENRNADEEKQLLEAKRELLRTHTPRPNWDDIENIIPDIGLENESSVNIAKELERYIADVQERLEEQEITLLKQQKILSFFNPEEEEEDELINENVQFFNGLGNGSDVPKYLRHVGRIKNKNLPKREVENLIQEVWKMRLKQNGFCPLEDIFDTFLSTRYGNVPVVKSEWAYNIIDGCKRYRSDPDCDLFLSVLEGEVSDDAYKGQFEMIDKLRNLFVKLDEKENNKITGFVKKKHINSALDKFFLGKSSDDLIKIKCMLHIQNPDPAVEYEKLFEEDRDHSQGIFVETIREQFLNEVQSYSRDIDRAINARSVKGKVSLLSVKQAFYDIDPFLQSSIVESYICKAIEYLKMEKADRKAKLAAKEEAKQELNWKEEIDLQLFLKNLKKILMIRRTKVEQIEEIKERNSKKKKKSQPQQQRKDK